MNTPTRLGLYGLGLALAFTGAVAVGRLAGPPEPTRAPRADHAVASPPGAGHGAIPAAPPDGLQVSDAGYRLVSLTSALSAGRPTEFRFQVVGPDGRPVTRYTATHEKALHLIVVRRDLSGFQHVHPTMAGDGTWSIPLTVAAAGQYRVFADFQPTGRDTALTLGVDVPAAGHYRPRAVPAPARTTEVDGYRVELAGDLVPGTASRLTLRVTRDAAPVTDLQPYLGAYGHLVALRDGDLAYLHVHPDGAPGDGRTPAGPDVTFYAEVPSAGTYRLFLDFRHDGTVRTAEFTAVAAVRGAGDTPPPATTPVAPGEDEEPHGHD
jgi:hypothetical protein